MLQFGANDTDFSPKSSTGSAPLALLEPRRDAAQNHAHNEGRKSHNVERHRYRKVRIGRIKRIERHGHELPISDCQCHQDGGSRNRDD